MLFNKILDAFQQDIKCKSQNNIYKLFQQEHKKYTSFIIDISIKYIGDYIKPVNK